MPRWFAVIPPGLEPALERELRALDVSAQVAAGGVRYDASIADGAALVPKLRTPTRVLLELAEGPARSMEELTALVRRVDWKKVLRPGANVEVHATTKGSRLHFKTSVEGKVGHFVKEALKGPRVVDREARSTQTQRIQVRVEDDRATLSLDAGGELLHFRGWRVEQGPAPLRENLAAAMLTVAGWDGEEPLVDPFCGSGTIPIEATLLALRRSPFTRRRFAFEEWPGVGPPKGKRTEARAAQVPVLGADRDGRVIAAAEENARRAGVDVMWRRVDVAELEPPPGVGLVVTNPPYGHRLDSGSDRVWEAFGRTLRARFTGWRVLFLAPHPALASRVHRDARCLVTFSNGGLKVGMWAVDAI